MTKKDLDIGDIVVLNGGLKLFFINSSSESLIFVCSLGYIRFENYNNSLIYTRYRDGHSDYSVKAIYKLRDKTINPYSYCNEKQTKTLVDPFDNLLQGNQYQLLQQRFINFLDYV